MQWICDSDVSSQLAKDIASLGLGFSQGKHVNSNVTRQREDILLCMKVQTQFCRVEWQLTLLY